MTKNQLMGLLITIMMFASSGLLAWQINQDEKADALDKRIQVLDKLILRQSIIMEKQVQYEEFRLNAKIISHSFEDEKKD